MKRILAAVLLLLVVPLQCFAHSGKTDSAGGHVDHSTGEYHYHHGYPAHDHYDMDGDGVRDCPYNFIDKTGSNSGSSSGGSSSSQKHETNKTEKQETTTEKNKEKGDNAIMLATELGWGVTLLIGATLGFIGFAILSFWIQLFSQNFDADSKCFWPLFWVHQIVWMVGVCVVPSDVVNENFSTWAIPLMVYFFGSIIVMAIVKLFKER